jgi:phosphate acetyltransferase
MQLIEEIIKKIQTQSQKKIIFSESEDPRILKACVHLCQHKLVTPILLGNPEELTAKIKTLTKGAELPIEIIDPNTSSHLPMFSEQLYEKRKLKGMDKQQAAQEVKKPLVFAYLMLDNNLADGTVNGAITTTGEVVKKAIQIIGLHSDSEIVSSFFIMSSTTNQNPKTYLFADCALVVEPTAEQLSYIAYDTIKNAKQLLQQPIRTAMLSFSTQGSAQHPEAQKVSEATMLLKKRLPDECIDGEIQFDAAIVPEICTQKYSNSQTQGNANIFIFPNLSAGNIGYKITQRLGDFTAIGPILQGLKKPANDLSRGCSVDDIINLAIITASQTL